MGELNKRAGGGKMRYRDLIGLLVGVLSFIILLSSQGFSQEEYAKEVKERVLRLPQCSQPLGVITARSFKC